MKNYVVFAKQNGQEKPITKPVTIKTATELIRHKLTVAINSGNHAMTFEGEGIDFRGQTKDTEFYIKEILQR